MSCNDNAVRLQSGSGWAAAKMHRSQTALLSIRNDTVAYNGA